MRFKNIDELVRYIISENINLQYSDIDIKTNIVDESIDLDACLKEENVGNHVDVKLTSLMDSPQIRAELSDASVIFVEDFQILKNVCGVGTIKFMGREIMTNVCEHEDTAHIILPIDMQDGKKYNISFKLEQLSENNESGALMKINKKDIYGEKTE